MKSRWLISQPCCALLVVISGAVQAASTEGLVYEPATGNYVLSYDCGSSDGVLSTTIIPANKVSPAVESAFEVVQSQYDYGGEFIQYRYTVSMGASSRQPLLMFAFEAVRPVFGIVAPPPPAMLNGASLTDVKKYQRDALESAPSDWKVFQATTYAGGSRVGWMRGLSSPAFVAGAKQQGFTFKSADLPGVAVAQFVGDQAGTWQFPCESPGSDTQVGRDLEVLERNNYVPRFAAAPLINYDHTSIGTLKALRGHLSQLVQWQLIDGAFATQFSVYLSDSIAKLEKGDRAGATLPLASARVALRSKYPLLESETVINAVPPSPIPVSPVDEIRKIVTDYDRVLAARVLDFDVDYVLRQLAEPDVDVSDLVISPP